MTVFRISNALLSRIPTTEDCMGRPNTSHEVSVPDNPGDGEREGPIYLYKKYDYTMRNKHCIGFVIFVLYLSVLHFHLFYRLGDSYQFIF